MQVGLVLWDWTRFNSFAYLKRPPLRSLGNPTSSPRPPLETSHALSCSPFSFSLGRPNTPPFWGIPISSTPKLLGIPTFAGSWCLVVTQSNGERQEKKRRRISRKEIKSWSRSRLRSDSTGWIFLEKKIQLEEGYSRMILSGYL